jgi:signal transduction histidine kinase
MTIGSDAPAIASQAAASVPRLERVFSRIVAVLVAVLGAQTVPSFVAQIPALSPWWSVGVVGVLSVALFAFMVAVLLQRAVRVTGLVSAYVFLLALLTWPLAVVDPAALAGQRPSLWLFLTVGAALIVLCAPPLGATIYTLLLPPVYAVARIVTGGAEVVQGALLDAIYVLVVNVVVLVLVLVLRESAASVDVAQASALKRYEIAVRQHAREIERSRVDALVHDEVLATLLAASRADSPADRAIAVDMARSAIRELAAAETSDPDEASPVALADLGERLRDVASTLGEPVSLTITDVPGVELPLTTAEAMYSAAVQALVNSQQHAGRQVARWLTVTGEEGHVVVEVGDRGRGFDVASIPAERLGVRVSIIERVSAAGGRAEIESSPERGTVVRMRWMP